MNLDAPLRELFGDNPRSADFLESDLGMGVQIPADGGEFVGKAFDAIDSGHVCYPMAGEWERDLTAIRVIKRSLSVAGTCDVDSSLRGAQATKQSASRMASRQFRIALSVPHGEEARSRRLEP
jgi:hypothetical protein